MSMGYVSSMEESKKLPCFLDSSSSWQQKWKSGRRFGTTPQCRECICSTLCFTFKVNGENIAGIFGWTHKKVMDTESSVNQPKETCFDNATLLLNCLPGALFAERSLSLTSYFWQRIVAIVPISISHGEREQIILFESAALKNKHGSTGIEKVEFPHKMCLPHTLPNPVARPALILELTADLSSHHLPDREQLGNRDRGWKRWSCNSPPRWIQLYVCMCWCNYYV